MRDQKKDVLAYLQEHGSITQRDAYIKFPAPITRLAAVIHELRKQYDIETVMENVQNCYGTVSYGRYVYHGKGENV